MPASRPKNIQIDYAFFLDLISHAFLYGDPDDPCFQRINSAFHKKLDAMERHDLYSLYKSGASREVREKAKEDYLQAIGLHDAFHWDADHDVNVMKNLNVLL